jgi:hypothetical protein
MHLYTAFPYSDTSSFVKGEGFTLWNSENKAGRYKTLNALYKSGFAKTSVYWNVLCSFVDVTQ